ncbi:MAG: citrate lyase acyl carrier protein [Firmicutes bacterium]|nr:citrate lyase acyl carrier protein [Dethiobacter sp.]MBS3889773.1 citrate lyase acyl carrier protein [Bacillota bacterium]
MIRRYAQAGSLESGDALVHVALAQDEALTIRIKSKVAPRFLASMQSSVREIATELGIMSATIEVMDSGALDFVLRARVTTAIKRSMEASVDE